MPTEQPFPCARYLNLGTFRKNGTRVDTPVWFVACGQKLYVFSNRDAGKVKRLKNNGKCMIAPCTFSGNVTGKWQPAHAQLVDQKPEVDLVNVALKEKYGWQMHLLNLGASLNGRVHQRAYIRIELT